MTPDSIELTLLIVIASYGSVLIALTILLHLKKAAP